MKPSLQLKISQQLTMTPQLQQAIRLLQLSTLDLQQEIQQALDANPMLEVDEESLDQAEPQTEQNSESPTPESVTASTSDDSGDPVADSDWNDDIPDDLSTDSNWDDTFQNATPAPTPSSSAATDEFESSDTASETLQDYLNWQLNLTPMSDVDRLIATAIIDGIDFDGYLRADINDILQQVSDDVDEVDAEEPMELAEVEAVLHRIQQFDPPGVAARDLSECLTNQLNQLPADTPFVKSAKIVVEKHLPLLGNHDYKQIMRRCRIKENELKSVISLIQEMNPKPGNMVQFGEVEYVIPDVYVRKERDEWIVSLNPEAAPKVRINDTYASMVKRADNSADNTFLRDHLQEARWFLKSLMSRNETLLKVANKIVEHQRDFLEHGEEAMKPLVLHDIAEAVEMHESTISRVTTQKFMHTPRGVFELKYFFSSHVSTSGGGECSSTAIRAIIKKLVAAENAAKPLSDSKIANLLDEQGIQVARRTIAKYREALQIPPSNERKRLL